MMKALMILYFVELFLLYIFRDKDIRKNVTFLDSDKEIIMKYFQNNIFFLLVLSLFIVLVPYMYIDKINEKYYIDSYIVITIFFFILSIYFNKKYIESSKTNTNIIAVQESNFGLKVNQKYKNRKYLNSIEKEMIKENNHFKFTVRPNDLTIQNIKLNKDYVSYEFQEFYKTLQKKKMKNANNLLYKKLINYINKKAKYHNLKPLEFRKKEYYLIEIQDKIFEKVKELNKRNVTLKVGQLFSIADDTLDMQFLSFLDCVKIKKYNNDSLMYAILFMKVKKI